MRVAAAVLAAVLAAGSLHGQAPRPLDAAMQAFWAADSVGRMTTATRQLIATGASYDELAARIKKGRTYTRRTTGRVDMRARDNGNELDNVLEVPAGYDPSRAWPLRVSLHGGVGRAAPGPNDPPARPLSNRIPLDDELVLHPRAFAQSEWWTRGQAENIARLLERVKRDFNVNEARIYLTGISDGGTGVYFFAMRAATPWAACLPLNGHPLVLANPDVGADGQLYPANLSNCPLRIVNGGRDQLYPAASVAPFVEMFRRGGNDLDFQVYPEAGHDVSWWPQERQPYASFLAAHSRPAHPTQITWETERTDRYNRFRWLVIDELGTRPSDTNLGDPNRYVRSPGRDAALYARTRPSGRVDAVRSGNTIDLKTRGVRALTLLLSPDAIDFTKPVRVTVNGQTVHDGVVKKDPATLLKWAAVDQDRTMVYGAELKVAVP